MRQDQAEQHRTTATLEDVREGAVRRRSPRLWTAAAMITLGLWVVAVVRAVLFGHVCIDEGYYLPNAERILDGWVPVRDLQVHYAPLGMYILAAAKWAGGGARSHGYFVSVMCAAGAASGLLVFFATRHLTAHQPIRLLGAATTMSQILYYDGTQILLEPLVMPFAVSALWASWSGPGRPFLFFVSGALGCLAFWTKQYGILLFVALIYFAWASGNSIRRRAERVALVVSGAFSVHLLVIGYFEIEGVAPGALLASLFWTGRGYSKSSLWLALVEFAFQFLMKTSPFLLFVPIMFWRRLHDPILISIALSIVGLGGALYVRQFAHYYILLAPFSSMMLVAFADEFASRRFGWGNWVGRSALVGLGAQCLIMPVHILRFIQRTGPGELDDVLAVSSAVARVVPAHARVALSAHPAVYFFADLYPADARRVGYMWSNFFWASEYEPVLRETSYVVIDTRDRDGFRFIDGARNSNTLTDLGFCKLENPYPGIGIWANRNQGFCTGGPPQHMRGENIDPERQ